MSILQCYNRYNIIYNNVHSLIKWCSSYPYALAKINEALGCDPSFQPSGKLLSAGKPLKQTALCSASVDVNFLRKFIEVLSIESIMHPVYLSVPSPSEQVNFRSISPGVQWKI